MKTFVWNLTSTVFFLLQFKLDSFVQLSGDKTVGDSHYHTGNEEEYKQQKDVPEIQTESDPRLINEPNNIGLNLYRPGKKEKNIIIIILERMSFAEAIIGCGTWRVSS